MFRSRLAPPPSVASKAADHISVPQRAADPFDLDGFERIDVAPPPPQIPRHLWDDVFPPDRPALLEIAGRLFFRGYEPEKAVTEALLEIDKRFWKKERCASALAKLSPCFPSKLPKPKGLPAEPIAAAVLAVTSTAFGSWREILSHKAPIKAAFLSRTWSAPSGRCLVCGDEATSAGPSADADMFPASLRPGRPDAIHRECKPAMGLIGPAFCSLVVEEAERLKAIEDKKPQAKEMEDPDMWSSFQEEMEVLVDSV